VVRDLSNGVNLLDTIGAQLNVGRKVLDALVLVQWAVHERRLNDVLLALRGLEQRLSEARASHGHGERCGSRAVLGLDDLVAAELHAVDVVVELLALEGVAGLGEQGHDGGAAVAADDRDVLGCGVRVLELGDEARGADDVEGGDAEEALGVVDALGLEDLGGDGDGGVDLGLLVAGYEIFYCDMYRVGDDQDVGFGCVLGGGLGQIADDGGVGVEQVWVAVSCTATTASFATHHHGSCRACGGHRRG
jgi:hypothetical protein